VSSLLSIYYNTRVVCVFQTDLSAKDIEGQHKILASQSTVPMFLVAVFFLYDFVY